MRIAVSNLAWPSGEDDRAAAILLDHGAEGVEIAPTKVWPRPIEAGPGEVAAYRRAWERRGLPIVALQSLLFGRPDLALFGGTAKRREAVAYLKGMIDLAAALGAGVLVFGAPRNRRASPLGPAEAEAIAVLTFRELGDYAARRGVVFCIEPNPVEYGCDFVTTASEGARLVEQVGGAGFGLHLDAAAMVLAGDLADGEIALTADGWHHLHVSEPDLVTIGEGGIDHPAIAAAARRATYDRWASIEMKEPPGEPTWAQAVESSLGLTKDIYGHGKT